MLATFFFFKLLVKIERPDAYLSFFLMKCSYYSYEYGLITNKTTTVLNLGGTLHNHDHIKYTAARNYMEFLGVGCRSIQIQRTNTIILS